MACAARDRQCIDSGAAWRFRGGRDQTLDSRGSCSGGRGPSLASEAHTRSTEGRTEMGALQATSHPGAKGRAGISGPASGIHICALPSSSGQPVGEVSGLTTEKDNSLWGFLPLICHQTASRLTKRSGRWKAHVVGQLGAARLSWEPRAFQAPAGLSSSPTLLPQWALAQGKERTPPCPQKVQPGPKMPTARGTHVTGTKSTSSHRSAGRSKTGLPETPRSY